MFGLEDFSCLNSNIRPILSSTICSVDKYTEFQVSTRIQNFLFRSVTEFGNVVLVKYRSTIRMIWVSRKWICITMNYAWSMYYFETIFLKLFRFVVQSFWTRKSTLVAHDHLVKGIAVHKGIFETATEIVILVVAFFLSSSSFYWLYWSKQLHALDPPLSVLRLLQFR